ncbi:MAG: hypothetical protein AAGJ67_18000 [Pseudomonadota bacterium]
MDDLLHHYEQDCSAGRAAIREQAHMKKPKQWFGLFHYNLCSNG